MAFTLLEIWTDIPPIITDLENEFLHEIYNPEAGHFSHPPLLEAACLSCPVLLKSAHKTQLLRELGPLAQSRMEDLALNQFTCRGPGAFTLCSLSTIGMGSHKTPVKSWAFGQMGAIWFEVCTSQMYRVHLRLLCF